MFLQQEKMSVTVVITINDTNKNANENNIEDRDARRPDKEAFMCQWKQNERIQFENEYHYF